MLVNGAAKNEVSVNDRGFLYGDGVFRTLVLRSGVPLHWRRQYQKLHHDCVVLSLSCPDERLLYDELSLLAQQCPDGVAKIVVTRGESQRGYASPQNQAANRILTVSPLPDYPVENRARGVRLHLCQLRLSRQPRLAGIKHLNRLENVLAASEWQDPDIAEGILLDDAGTVVEGTRTNLFAVMHGELYTSGLTRCGVAGVQRERVLAWAEKNQIACYQSDFGLDELIQADEIFLVNSVIGLWPVREMPGYHRAHFPLAQKIGDWLDDETN